jgi:3-oxoacyl-[acyl-carrier protein] reductase
MRRDDVVLITGTRKGIGRHLAEHFASAGFQVVGCSRNESDFQHEHYTHHCLDVTDEDAVRKLIAEIRKRFGRLDVLVNNAGLASMNHFLLTPQATVEKLLGTNFMGTFLFCREAAKLMKSGERGRIVNFTTVAVPLKLAGEAVYAASKSAVETLTQILAYELAEFRITVNAVGPTPVDTDLIRSVPEEKIAALLDRQAIGRLANMQDISNVVDFFVREESDFVTGQILYLGGV